MLSDELALLPLVIALAKRCQTRPLWHIKSIGEPLSRVASTYSVYSRLWPPMIFFPDIRGVPPIAAYSCLWPLMAVYDLHGPPMDDYIFKNESTRNLVKFIHLQPPMAAYEPVTIGAWLVGGHARIQKCLAEPPLCMPFSLSGSRPRFVVWFNIVTAIAIKFGMLIANFIVDLPLWTAFGTGLSILPPPVYQPPLWSAAIVTSPPG